MLVEHDTLVCCHMLTPHQNTGHNNAFPFCRQDAILGGFVQGSELVVGRGPVTIRDGVLSLRHTSGHGVSPCPSIRNSPCLYLPHAYSSRFPRAWKD